MGNLCVKDNAENDSVCSGIPQCVETPSGKPICTALRGGVVFPDRRKSF